LKELLNVEQVGKIIQADPQLVRIRLRSGELIGAKIAKRWLVDIEDLEAYVNSKKNVKKNGS